MKTSVLQIKLKHLLLLLPFSFIVKGFGQTASVVAPELVFVNPVLKSGTDKKEGAVYRFSNITTGVDAELKLKKFSRPDIVMNSIDNPTLGWNKAFQPEFGLAGIVQPNQNWYVDFELTFLNAGSDKKVKMSKVNLTALDVDGDGVSIAEYIIMSDPSSVKFSTITNLQGSVSQQVSIGQAAVCQLDNTSSVIAVCNMCGGTGSVSGGVCDQCDGSGKIFSGCHDPFQTLSTVTGPVENYVNIDTAATQVMATYTYLNTEKIKFRYGAKSGSAAVNGSGVRLNSQWFREFSLAPVRILPVTISGFTGTLDDKRVTLNWSTSYEENFSHFVVQRSIDGKNYSDAGIVFTGASFREYNFSDNLISSPTGLLYYRLLMVDKTGEGKFSVVRMFRLGKDARPERLLIYPNPVRNEVRITLPKEWQNRQVQIELLASDGSKIFSEDIRKASQTEVLNVSGLPAGAYIIQAISNGVKTKQTLIKH